MHTKILSKLFFCFWFLILAVAVETSFSALPDFSVDVHAVPSYRVIHGALEYFKDKPEYSNEVWLMRKFLINMDNIYPILTQGESEEEVFFLKKFIMAHALFTLDDSGEISISVTHLNEFIAWAPLQALTAERCTYKQALLVTILLKEILSLDLFQEESIEAVSHDKRGRRVSRTSFSIGALFMAALAGMWWWGTRGGPEQSDVPSSEPEIIPGSKTFAVEKTLSSRKPKNISKLKQRAAAKNSIRSLIKNHGPQYPLLTWSDAAVIFAPDPVLRLNLKKLNGVIAHFFAPQEPVGDHPRYLSLTWHDTPTVLEQPEVISLPEIVASFSSSTEDTEDEKEVMVEKSDLQNENSGENISQSSDTTKNVPKQPNDPFYENKTLYYLPLKGGGSAQNNQIVVRSATPAPSKIPRYVAKSPTKLSPTNNNAKSKIPRSRTVSPSSPQSSVARTSSPKESSPKKVDLFTSLKVDRRPPQCWKIEKNYTEPELKNYIKKASPQKKKHWQPGEIKIFKPINSDFYEVYIDKDVKVPCTCSPELLEYLGLSESKKTEKKPCEHMQS